MTTVPSTWTLSAPPPLTGLLPATEACRRYNGNALGTLMAQNDPTNLYIGLDLTSIPARRIPFRTCCFNGQLPLNPTGCISSK